MFRTIVAIVGALLGIGGGAYGYDQYQKRKKERLRFNAEIARLEGLISVKVVELDKLTQRLGAKNEQVRALAKEVRELREQLGEARSRASA